MKMEIGQIVDYCIAYNNIHEVADNDRHEVVSSRKATQADWNNLLGG